MAEGDRTSKTEFELVSKSPLGPAGTIIAVLLAIFLFTGIAWFVGGSVGMQFAGVAVSGILSAALVGLYYHQTVLLNDQIDLRTQEINREVRLNHTEALRQRVYAWLGTDDLPQTITSIEDIFRDEDNRLPKVTATDVQPADDYIETIGEPDEFHVIPFGLEDDRYFEDLLKNHAQELEEHAETINEHYSEFVDLRSRFEDGFEGVKIEEEKLRVEPDVFLKNSIFEGIVKIERARKEDWKDVLGPVISGFEKGGNRKPEENELLFMGGIRKQRSLYYVTSESQSIDEISAEYAEGLAKKAMEKTVSRVDTDEEPYRYAIEAATILDTIEEEIRELRNALIEYAGRPVYQGSCEYLSESALGSFEDNNGTSKMRQD